MQREVEIDVETVDKTGTFLGSITMNGGKFNLAGILLRTSTQPTLNLLLILILIHFLFILILILFNLLLPLRLLLLLIRAPMCHP
jgi:hypothetical protein